MANVLDSARLVLTDNNAFTKIAILGLIVFGVDELLFIGNTKTINFANIIFVIPLLLVYIGYLFRTLGRSMADRPSVLPSLNAISSLIVGTKGLISTGIFVIPIYYMHTLLSEKVIFPPVENFQTLVQFCGCGIIDLIGYSLAASFFFTSVIFFSKKYNVKEGLNIVNILKNFHEIWVYLIFTILMLAILNIITSLLILLAIYSIFGDGKIYTYATYAIITINTLVIFQNLSQAYYEQINDATK